MEGNSDRKKADHLCVLVHGLWGTPGHLKYMASALREQFPTELHILVTKRNQGSFTYDGIELGGERVTREIEETIEDLAREGRPIRKLSVMGYSLGGLIARYAIGLLDSKGWFEKIEPVNFTTFATPHLGARTPLKGYLNKVWNGLGSTMLSMSGKQLFLTDKFRETGRPLLSLLADPNSVFVQALKKFKHRSLYANVVNDRTAVYYTTSISRTDPFVEPDKLDVHYLDGYEPVILDPKRPATLKHQERNPSLSKQVLSRSRAVLEAAPMALLFVVFIPVGSILFSVNAAIQAVRSPQRIRLHEEGRAGVGVGMYRVPLMVENVRRRAEDLFEHANTAQGPDYLVPERADGRSAEKADDEGATARNGGDFPALALTGGQLEMIEALDEVGWSKYGVYIHKVHHSHAAIVYRTQRRWYNEGKVVARHWTDGFEI